MTCHMSDASPEPFPDPHAMPSQLAVQRMPVNFGSYPTICSAAKRLRAVAQCAILGLCCRSDVKEWSTWPPLVLVN